MEQFIPDHVFLYVTRGAIAAYDGSKTYTLRQGDYCLVRKNRLARYNSEKGSGFDRIFFCFEEDFLRGFQERHKVTATKYDREDTFVKINPTEKIPDFIQSLKPYTDAAGRLEAAFEDVKYEELLIILLQNQPALAGILFDYSRPEKINLEEFMNRNYKFNVSNERFAWLTGRSLSAFKRDFRATFGTSPGQWLTRRRLKEAYILIEKENKRASEIYLDLGFQDLSHFSLAFKKLFGVRPTEVAGGRGRKSIVGLLRT